MNTPSKAESDDITIYYDRHSNWAYGIIFLLTSILLAQLMYWTYNSAQGIFDYGKLGFLLILLLVCLAGTCFYGSRWRGNRFVLQKDHLFVPGRYIWSRTFRIPYSEITNVVLFGEYWHYIRIGYILSFNLIDPQKYNCHLGGLIRKGDLTFSLSNNWRITDKIRSIEKKLQTEVELVACSLAKNDTKHLDALLGKLGERAICVKPFVIPRLYTYKGKVQYFDSGAIHLNRTRVKICMWIDGKCHTKTVSYQQICFKYIERDVLQFSILPKSWLMRFLGRETIYLLEISDPDEMKFLEQIFPIRVSEPYVQECNQAAEFEANYNSVCPFVSSGLVLAYLGILVCFLWKNWSHISGLFLSCWQAFGQTIHWLPSCAELQAAYQRSIELAHQTCNLMDISTAYSSREELWQLIYAPFWNLYIIDFVVITVLLAWASTRMEKIWGHWNTTLHFSAKFLYQRVAHPMELQRPVLCGYERRSA